jgi:hypothetical protein
MKRCVVILLLWCCAAGLARAENTPAAAESAPAASADGGRWVKTVVWTGTGTRQTALFRVAPGEWAIRHSHTGTGLFQVMLYDDRGTLLGVPVNMDRPLPGRVRAAEGAGVRYFSVTSDGEWTLSVEQKLTAVEEWELVQANRREAQTKLLLKRTELAGGPGTVTHDYKLPPGRWKILCTNLSGGRLEIQAKDGEKERLVLAAASAKVETMEGWMYGGGKLSVTLRAEDKASWKFEIYGETDKPAGAPVPPGAATAKEPRPATVPAKKSGG